MLAAGASVTTASAQPNQSPPKGFDSPENVFELIEERRREGMLQKGASWLGDKGGVLLDPLDDWRQQTRQTQRLDWTLETTGLYQFHTASGKPKETNVLDINFAGIWQPIASEETGDGYIGWLARYRGSTRTNTGKFDNGLGLVSNTHDLQTDGELLAILQLWYQHRFADDAFRVTVGKIDQGAYFNGSEYAGNAKELFLSTPLSANPARGTPQEGLGANFAYFDPSNQWYVATGLGDANAVNTHSPFDKIDEGDFTYLGEFGWTPTFGPHGHAGTYRFTLMSVDATLNAPSGWSAAFSGDQDVSDKVGVFLRYSINDGDRLPIEQVASTGLVYKEPMSIKGDAIGLGGFWVDPADNSIDDQYGLETFWRMQLTDRLEFTPGVQWQINPNKAVAQDNSALVFSLRLRLLI